MNFLLITGIGSRGDVNPFITIGKLLINRGHTAILVSGEIYRTIAAEAGVGFIAYYPEDLSRLHIDSPSAYDTNPKKTLEFITKNYLPVMVHSLYKIISDFKPKETALISCDAVFGARLANEKLNFPLISICLQPIAIWSLEKPPTLPNNVKPPKMPGILQKVAGRLIDYYVDKAIATPINCFRKDLQLPKIKRISSQWRYSPEKVIGLFPEWFCPRASDWPKNTELTGFINPNYLPEQNLSSDILEFLSAGSPPLFLTYGTEMTQSKQFFATSVAAARQLGYRCLLLTKYASQLPELNSENEIHISSYVSLTKLLPHCAAIAYHGGIGTLTQAIVAGIPQLVVPFFVDQPDNATRLKKLGLCISVPIKKYSLTIAVNSLTQLLNSSEIKENCLQYSKKINFKDAEDKLCSIIEKTLKLDK